MLYTGRVSKGHPPRTAYIYQCSQIPSKDSFFPESARDHKTCLLNEYCHTFLMHYAKTYAQMEIPEGTPRQLAIQARQARAIGKAMNIHLGVQDPKEPLATERIQSTLKTIGYQMTGRQIHRIWPIRDVFLQGGNIQILRIPYHTPSKNWDWEYMPQDLILLGLQKQERAPVQEFFQCYP